MISALLSRCLMLVLGTLYPAYRSYKAIKNKDVREYVKWMMYWIVFALFTTLETFLDIFLSWFPFYYEIKIVFILWVLSPATRGSSLLYKKVVHPMLTSREKEIDELIEKTKQQGYTTFIQLFTSGFQYASTFFVNSSQRGQTLLGDHLKKSLSLNDVDTNNIQTQAEFTSHSNSVATGNVTRVYRKPDTINEEEDSDFDYEQDFHTTSGLQYKKTTNSYRSGNYDQTSIQTIPKQTSATTRKASSTAISSKYIYDKLDDDVVTLDSPDDSQDDAAKKNKRRASSKQLGSTYANGTSSTNGITTTTNYKSNEASHYGTLTRGKTLKTKTLAGGSNPINT
jgi:receptor expression-enhancing protein 1/2/3/4